MTTDRPFNKIRAIAAGMENDSESGAFGLTKENELKDFILSLEKIKKESNEQMKKTNNLFK